jgi:hypothetical protein
MADQIVITEKTSQAKDVRAAVGTRYGEILPDGSSMPSKPMPVKRRAALAASREVGVERRLNYPALGQAR